MSPFESHEPSDDTELSSETVQEGNEQMEQVNDTASFHRAIETGRLDDVAAWLETAKGDPRYDERWVDHRSRELMNALIEAGRVDEAEKYVDYAQTETGRRGRRDKFTRIRQQSS